MSDGLGVEFNTLRENFIIAHYRGAKVSASFSPVSFIDDTLYVSADGTCFTISEYMIDQQREWMQAYPHLQVEEVVLSAKSFPASWDWDHKVNIAVHISTDDAVTPLLIVRVDSEELAKAIATSKDPEKQAVELVRKILHAPFSYVDFFIEDASGQECFTFDSETSPLGVLQCVGSLRIW